MAEKTVFTNIPSAPDPEPQTAVASQFGSFREIQIGFGAKCFHADSQGIWLGAEKYASAPFRVDMSGNVYASSITLTGYVAVGGAAADVNSYATTISGGKITTGSVTATQIAASTITGSNIAASTITGSNIAATTITASNIQAGTITTTQIAASTITGGNIAASTISGSNISANTITASNIAAGTITATEIAASTITGSKIASGTITATNIASSTITADKMNVSTLSAIAADMGTITAGTIKVSSRINIQKSDTTAVAYIGSDPDSLGLWGFIANRGYGLMCKYSSSSYFRIFMDGSATDAIIDLPTPDKLKFQDNSGAAIMRLYGNAGWGGSPGGLVDLFHPLRLYTYDYSGGTSGGPEAGSYAYEGMVYTRLNYGGGSEDNIRVYVGGTWRSVQTT